MIDLQELEAALFRYTQSFNDYELGAMSYSQIELPKLDIADAVLRLVALKTSPEEQAFKDRKNWQAEKVTLRAGFVYLMQNCRNGYTKIGFSTNPRYREKTLQSEEPEVELVGYWPGTLAKELALHIQFSRKRVRGEWFNLTQDEINEIQEAVSK